MVHVTGMAAAERLSDAVKFIYVGNIPGGYRSVDLRASFSQFIESHGFSTFHYRHRPEHKLSKGQNSHESSFASSTSTDVGNRDSMVNSPACSTNDGNNFPNIPDVRKDDIPDPKSPLSFCCVTRIVADRVTEFKRLYSSGTFCDRNGRYSERRILFKVISKDPCQEELKGTKITETDFYKLPELNPPPEMPNGNVGTPLAVFLNLIKSCSLPSSVIRKFGLEFPKSASKRKYGNVPYKYTDRRRQGTYYDREPKINESMGNPLVQYSKDQTKKGKDEVLISKKIINEEKLKPFAQNDDIDLQPTISVNLNRLGNDRVNSSDTEEPEEDWERHQALHDDVDAQGRTTERLFEEDIELKWEKGGSGLVFYTDAYYWNEMKGKDFDEETADDWDVDMSIYTEPNGGDMDVRDLLKMRVSDRWSKGLDDGPTDVLEFERYTKAFGSRQLIKNGWRKGSGIGSSKIGITDPIEAVGQSSRDKTGFGYLGAKLNRHPKSRKRRAERDVVISTIYDEERDKEDNAMQRAGPNVLTYIDKPVAFVSMGNK